MSGYAQSWVESPPTAGRPSEEELWHRAAEHRAELLGVAIAVHSARLQSRKFLQAARDEAYAQDEPSTAEEVYADVEEAAMLIAAVNARAKPPAAFA